MTLTLDHLTNGRVGWNLVTSYSDSAARDLGTGQQIPHDERYDMAAEYLEVCYKLWEASWQDDAVVRDRDNGVYVDPRRLYDINHHGKYFDPKFQHTLIGQSSRGGVEEHLLAGGRGEQQPAYRAGPGHDGAHLRAVHRDRRLMVGGVDQTQLHAADVPHGRIDDDRLVPGGFVSIVGARRGCYWTATWPSPGAVRSVGCSPRGCARLSCV